ncbi:MAG: type I pullulanase, partial [Oscillospiraceae bacterium]|nr:type I pullulanase [Oscillospiraceae bacterium]
MLFKKIITGVLVLTMAIGTSLTSFSASASADYSKEAAQLEKTIYSENDLGAVYDKNHTVFKVWAPNAEKVSTRVYETGSDDENGAKVITTKSMTLDKKTGVWSVKISGDLKNKYYTYIITRGGKDVETGDIYAKGAGVNGNRSMVVDLQSTNPEGWSEDKHVTVSKATDASVWEVSVRDFSISSTSGVSEKNRGKYLAFTETGTTVNSTKGNQSTCVDYLKELGVKYVQIMPFYDFGSIDESKDLSDQYNWGYDPKNYNVPEGSYSSDPYKGEVRIKECKEMIKALHDAGIGVIMDVVYNHTYTVEDSFFNLTVPNYYYRRNNDGTWSNGSGCGNDTASEHKMFRKFIVDSVTYWAEEYHIDGFRFDLMGLHDVDTMNEIRASLDKLENGKNIIMYGEAWNLSTNAESGTVLANQNNMNKLDDRIGAFDDTVRDAIKGSSFVLNEKGFVQSGSQKGNLKIGIEAQSKSTTGWAKAPTQCVTYASCHDNYTLYDKLAASVKGENPDYRKRYEDLVAMNKLSAAIVYTSQGIPFVLSGEEFARSKDGEGNSYNTSNEQNELVWTNLTYYGDLVEYYKGLMQIRNNFS